MKECDCKVCIRHRKFKEIINDTENEDIKVFINDIFETLYNVEEELEFVNIYQENLKIRYPEIYKEVRTIELLKKD